jgi:hypothetical protein
LSIKEGLELDVIDDVSLKVGQRMETSKGFDSHKS